jgi:hypothetical protein
VTLPDHSQNQAVSSTVKQPPRVKNRMKKGTLGGETTFALFILWSSTKYADNPTIGVRT